MLDRKSGKGRVIGEHGASLIDVRGAVETATGVDGVRWSYLNAGDEINLKNAADVKAGKGAKKLKPAGDDVAVRDDIWDSIDGFGGVYSLRDFAQQVVASAAGTGTGLSYETAPQFATELERDNATKAWTTDGGKISFSGLKMDIVQVD